MSRRTGVVPDGQTRSSSTAVPSEDRQGGHPLGRWSRSSRPPRQRESTWSPDNSKIAYLKTTGGRDRHLDDEHRRTGTGAADVAWATLAVPEQCGGRVAWSPDSEQARVRPRPGPVRDLGRQCQRNECARDHDVRPLSLSAFAPAWSPDGTQIVFVEAATTLELMNADGSGVHQLNPHTSFTDNELRRTSWSSTTLQLRGQAAAAGSRSPAIRSSASNSRRASPVGSASPARPLFQWLRCQPSTSATTYSSATDSTYGPTPADLGYYLRVELTLANVTAGSCRPRRRLSCRRWPIASTLPTVPDSAASGSTLSINTDPGTWSGSPTFSTAGCAADPSGGRVLDDRRREIRREYTVSSCSDVGSTLRATGSVRTPAASNAATHVPLGGRAPARRCRERRRRRRWRRWRRRRLPPNMRVHMDVRLEHVAALRERGRLRGHRRQPWSGGNGRNCTTCIHAAGGDEAGRAAVLRARLRLRRGHRSIECNLGYVANGSSTVVKFGVTIRAQERSR